MELDGARDEGSFGAVRKMKSQLQAVSSHDVVNLVSLMSIQVSNAVTPLLVFPFTLKVVGAAAYSELAVTESIAAALACAGQYSFDMDGVGKIAGLDLEKDRERISHEFSLVLVTRLAIFAVASLVALVLGPLVPNCRLELIAWWLLVPLSSILTSMWLFMGVQRILPVAVTIGISRLIFVIVLFCSIKGPEDQALIPALMGITFLGGGLATLVYIKLSYGLKLVGVAVSEVIEAVREGFAVFSSNLSILLFKDTNVLILSFASVSPSMIATYSVAEKLVKSLQATTRPINQLYFPKLLARLDRRQKPDRKAAHDVLASSLAPLAICAAEVVFLACVCVILQAFTRVMDSYPRSGEIMLLCGLMIPSLFFGTLNFMFGFVGLNFLGMRYYFFRSVLIVGLANWVTCLILVQLVPATGAALSYTFTEILLLALCVMPYFR